MKALRHSNKTPHEYEGAASRSHFNGFLGPDLRSGLEMTNWVLLEPFESFRARGLITRSRDADRVF